MNATNPWGLQVVVSPALPTCPSPEAIGRRIARHVFADELRSLGREVGPRPDDLGHAFWLGERLVVSAEFAETLRAVTP